MDSAGKIFTCIPLKRVKQLRDDRNRDFEEGKGDHLDVH